MKNIGIKNIITGVFVVGALFGFLIFSGAIDVGNDTQEARGSVIVWGTTDAQKMQPYIDLTKNQNLTVTYYQKQTATYENELINAFASGSGPDLFIMPHENILRHSDKVLEIPYASFTKDLYESTYIDEARLFLTDTGVTAFPLTVDPLIMYYNKALISSAFILDVPQYWDEFAEFSNAITRYNGTGEVSIAAAALGTYDNVINSKAIMSALILQNGNSIVGTDSRDSTKFSLLSSSGETQVKTNQALDFYTSFSDFGSDTYSWNEALVDSRNKFIAGELALYFGRASEVQDIRRKNPNLDFSAELLPQVRGNTIKLTQGAMMGIGISKQSKNINGSIAVASTMAGSVIADGLAVELQVAPARKDLLRNKPEDAFKTLVYNSAIISRGWIDPDPEKSSTIFRTMLRNINTGALSVSASVDRANADLDTLLDQTINIAIKSR
ncbi:MAG: ABC-type glycerol-3-phosphate transport system substrate-binding protein [Crocinitomicaceae bacterium]|jgi:ABC-type glycerol-3-phosphate transport system substrate-binding protein